MRASMIQRVVTALPFLLPVKSDGRAFSETPGRQYRTIEVQRDAGRLQAPDLIQHPLPAELTQMGDTSVIQARQRPANGGHIRQMFQPQQAAHHGIVLVVAHILKSAITQQEVDYQQQDDDAVTIDRADGQVAETPGELLLQADPAEQRLVHHQTGKRGQSLILKFNLGNTMGLAMNGGFATLHVDGLFWLSCWVGAYQFYQARDRFFMAEKHFLSSISMLSGPHFW